MREKQCFPLHEISTVGVLMYQASFYDTNKQVYYVCTSTNVNTNIKVLIERVAAVYGGFENSRAARDLISIFKNNSNCTIFRNDMRLQKL